ncbi:MAG: Rne/Rng family ribonuclease [Pseudomonadota bacterium]
MSRKMLIDAANEEEVRVCVLENKRVEEFDFESASRKALRGNIYLARVTRVEPSLQAAFVEYGGNRHGFLAFSEIHPDYYQIPVSDREAIRAAEAEEADLAERLNLHPSEEDERGEGNGDVDVDDAEATAAPDAAADDETREETREEKPPKSRRGRRRRKSKAADAATSEESAEDTLKEDAEAAAEGAPPDGDATRDNADPDDADTDDADTDDADTDDAKKSAGPRGDESVETAIELDEAASGDPTDQRREEEEEEEEEEKERPDLDEADGQDQGSQDAPTAAKKNVVSAASEDDRQSPAEDDGGEAASDSNTEHLDQDDPSDAEGEALAEANDPALEADDDEGVLAEASDSDDGDEADTASDEDDADDDSDDSDDDGLDAATRKDLMKRYEEARRKRMRLLRNYKIQEVIKRRQILLVQVVKEERGNKGAALTTYLSLAGRYCVLMPNTARGGGISRKIPNASDRKRLRKVVDGLEVPKGMGLIIRTAGAKRTKAEIKRDYDYLARLWENIRAQTLKSIAPALIYEEASLIKRAIRDLYDKDIEEVLVHGEAGYREAKDFMKMLMPSHAKNVQPYKDERPLFLKYGVEKQLDDMYEPEVRLKSGGYLVINQTEALIAIDVNSGKATRERNIEQTALKTNLEAAKELARQCRLRDLAGLIVVDFIDMDEHRNNRSVEKKFKEALKTDRARIQVGRISSFGLLEMSRQRRRSGIVDGTTHACPTCHGAGVVRSREMAGLRILRAIEGEAIDGRAEVLRVKASADVVLYVLNEKRDWLGRIEGAYGVKIELLADVAKHGDHYEIERRGARKTSQVAAAVRADLSEMAEVDNEAASDPQDEKPQRDRPAEASADEDDGERKRRRRRRRRKGGDADAAADGDSGGTADGEAKSGENGDEARAGADGEDDDDKPKKRRRRGRRGGRRNARKEDEGADIEAETETDAGPAETPDIGAEAAAGENSDPSQSNDEDTASTESGIAEDDNAPAEDAAPQVEPPSAEPEREAEAAAREEAAAALASPPENEGDEIGAAASTPEPPKKRKPARKGWWQRAIGG